MLCRSCTRGACTSLSTAESRVEIECPVCDGTGLVGAETRCDACNDGVFEIDGCPNTFCSQVVRSIDLIDLFGKGLPPVSGGVLDQSASFIEAVRLFESEENRVKNERSSRDPD